MKKCTSKLMEAIEELASCEARDLPLADSRRQQAKEKAEQALEEIIDARINERFADDGK